MFTCQAESGKWFTSPAFGSRLDFPWTECNDTDCGSAAQVVRCFEDDDVIHVDGRVDPASDADVINLELAFADLGQIERR